MAASAADVSIGALLLERRLITLPQHDEALALVERWSAPIQDALMARDWIKPDALYRATASYYDLPFIERLAEEADASLLVEAESERYLRTLTIPWRRENGRLILATARPGPETFLAARKRYGPDISLAIASRSEVIRLAQQVFSARHSHQAVYELAETDPEMSAQQVITRPQMMALYGIFSLFALGLALAPIGTLIALNAAMSLFYLGNFTFKGVLVWLGGRFEGASSEALAADARSLTDAELPVYTILVPMFKEPEVLPILAHALRRLDYPLGKLDIKIVLEESDRETIEAAEKLGLEGVFEIIRVPASKPQTKPKACNYALRYARGDLLVIFDAEDKPEPDQLRKVVAAFRRAPSNTACIQCRLNYYNARENWLTRMFTLDYSLWFDLMLPGLERLRAPIPLGGTSNHFKIDVLRRLSAWDPFNVTEDADLGIRLTQKGYRVGVIDSTTFEEANCRQGNWVRQRSRWIKGYMQTLLVHTRRPVGLVRSVGWLGVMGFVFFVGGTMLSGLLNPLFWATFLIWLVTATAGFDPFFPPVLLYLSLVNLLGGNGAFIYLSMIAPFRRRWLDLVPYSLSVFWYWALMSAAAYKGLWQLINNPFYWEKTQHGISKHTATELAEAHGGAKP